MDSIIARVDAWLIALAFAVAMLACWSLGWRRGRHFSAESGEDPGTKFIDGSVAILGLLLAFTFAMSLGRHDHRRLTVVDESNAIGDFYTCASLLKEPYRSRLQTVIRDYTQNLLDTSQEPLLEVKEKETIKRWLAIYDRMTEIVNEAIAAGTPIAVPLTNTLNDVTSSSGSRLAAYRERLPWSIVLLLFLSSIAPSFLIGEKQGASHKVHLLGSFSFIVLVALVIFVTFDLNQPHRGLIRVSQDSLEVVTHSMAK